VVRTISLSNSVSANPSHRSLLLICIQASRTGHDGQNCDSIRASIEHRAKNTALNVAIDRL